MSRFHSRTLHLQDAGPWHVLEALHDGGTDPRRVQLFFTKGTPITEIQALPGTAVEGLFTIGDAPVLRAALPEPADHIDLRVGFQDARIAVSPTETDLFAGLNVGFATRNGETAEVTRDWITWHMRHHGMTGVLILDRAQPGADPDYGNQLLDLLQDIEGLECGVLLNCNFPLGAPDLPHESHPFNVPGAPGKDRMEIPDSDPWHAPLDCGHLWELVRHRFLAQAAAVMNIDLHDLVRIDAPGPFERAAQEGVVHLAGRQCYPWRVRNDDEAHFSDHICVPFDDKSWRRKWCVAPAAAGPRAVWRPNRIVGMDPKMPDPVLFDRHIAVRHDSESIAKIVPKSSLIEDPYLLDQSRRIWDHKPVQMPEVKLERRGTGPLRTAIVTCMKNEGPFILEWLAFHRAIGVTDIIVYTNDCDDGTDQFLNLLQEKGYVQHRDNPFRSTGQKPQHAALAASDDEDCVKNADWVISMDVDEFINIKVGEGRLQDLFDAVPDANMIACTWRLFGNSDIHEYREDELLMQDYTLCAREFSNKPHQAWGFKTLFKQLGIFKKMGVHRPKGLNPQLWNQINWVNGSGRPFPKEMYRNAWRATSTTYGYDLVQLNHYAVRSAESFLVKRDRGRVNHVDRDQGLAYWFRMNNNGEPDLSIQNKIPMMLEERDKLMSDPDIRAQHDACVAAHRAKIDSLRERPDQKQFYATLTGARMERLARMHKHFGANVFLGGPDTVPDDVVFADHDEGFFFTVDTIDETQH